MMILIFILGISFFIFSASVEARDVCLCKTHKNFTFEAKALKKWGIMGTDDLNIIIESTIYFPKRKNVARCYKTYNICIYIHSLHNLLLSFVSRI